LETRKPKKAARHSADPVEEMYRESFLFLIPAGDKNFPCASRFG
jgi:hypothetical protein